MRIVLVGAVESTAVTLEALCSAKQPPVAVLSLSPALKDRHSDYVDMRAASTAAGVPFFAVDDVNSEQTVVLLESLAIDWLVVVGWSQICSPRVLGTAAQGAIGYHPAPLPKLRGRSVIAWTLLLGLKDTAGSLFFMAAEVDSGALLAQRHFKLDEREDVGSLLTRHMTALRAMWTDILPLGEAASMDAVEQAGAAASYCARRFPSDGEIDWTLPAEAIDRLVRAVSAPYPGAFSFYRGRRILIDAAQPWTGDVHYAAPGQIVQRTDGALLISCGGYTALLVERWRWADDGDGRAPPVGRRLSRG